MDRRVPSGRYLPGPAPVHTKQGSTDRACLAVLLVLIVLSITTVNLSTMAEIGRVVRDFEARHSNASGETTAMCWIYDVRIDCLFYEAL